MTTIDDANEADRVLDTETREAQREDAERMRQWKAKQDEDDVLFIMSYTAGRRWIWNLLAPLWRSPFTGEREGTDLRLGEHNAALKVWAQVQRVCPKLVLKMQEENPHV